MPRLPLEGMTVLDLTQIIAGPFCTLLLADMGADVIKIEKPQGGDDTRHLGRHFINGQSAAFLVVNRNKRSLVLNLKTPQARDILRCLASRADVVVENFRPGVMERLGLDYERLKDLNPFLIYCTISGFGSTGPYKDRGGFDLVTQGMSGIMSVTGIPGSPPVKVGVPITDLSAGMYAAYGILCAYISRLRTGQGQLVDTSLLEAGIAYTFWESGEFFATGESPQPLGSAHRLSAPYQALRTKDGYINVGAANQANWERLCCALGHEELLTDPRFAANPDRLNNREELVALLEETLSSESSEHWLEVLEKGGVPSGPLYNMAGVYSDPHVLARNMLVEIEHPEAGRIKNIGIPVKLSQTPGSIRLPPPLLGQHTDQILSSFGYSQEEIEAFRAEGIVK